ncbi:ADP-ribosylation factor 6 [Harpegnathos saltator]|uniref:ADP-ribosylation factor-like protein 5 n=1 Tax=Harpegnathos saltator TaxID=610380 RepID=E2B7J3_HARSA|nr:ADP-ribosylation factor 6 [Harpegnathos saltator]XP_011154027.1 ADP-ribosylation factor 6 [Harpegnathos saltator]EFN88368.1 ADP-ribosylation factor-like protein 5 [Harpegnathos saltator]
MNKYPLTESQKTFLWVSCTCVGMYVAYRYWKKRKLKTINERFGEISKLLSKPQKRVVLLGLKGAGKTLLVNQMTVSNNNDFSYTMPPQPTKGSLITRLKNDLCYYNIWEVGGIDTLDDVITYWTMFSYDVDLMVFVIDSNDTDKLSVIASSLKQFINNPQLSKTPILIVANKQDCPNALKPEQVEQALDLLSLSHKHKIELIGCQTEPLPCLSEGETNYKWCHSSVVLVMKKMFSMAIS